MPVKRKDPGKFEVSYRLFHRLAKRDSREAARVICIIRRAALIAQLKKAQGGK
jgi:hypothetical protein